MNVTFGDFEFNREARRLTRAGRVVSLTGKPLELLAILLEKPGIAVTREDIRRRLGVEDPIIDVTLARLRSALREEQQPRPFIEEVPRIGYRFVSATMAPRVTSIRARRRGGARRIAMVAILVLLGIVAVLLRSTEWLAALGGRVSGRRLERVRQSPRFSDGKFRNPEPTRMVSGSFLDMARRQFFGREQREPVTPIPVVPRSARDYASPPTSGLRATWIGWSSVLLEIDGHTVLTDPVWSERCSPSTIVGPKRFHAPPIALGDLPHIEVVVISHDHYDHLDMPVIRALGARGTHFAVPLGVGAHLERWDIPAAQIYELDWHQSIDLNGLSITATPARHYSGRNPLRANQTLWASWVVKGPQHRVFFSGDTGYSDAFRRIGAAHGPFDLTLIKIGASDPTWSEIHMTPEEAVATHRDVRGRVMLPVHWATFNLAFHPWREPADRAVAAAAKAGVTLVVPKPGELIEPAVVEKSPRVWW